MAVKHILLLDDDDSVRRSLSDVLREFGKTVLAVSSVLQARHALDADQFDLFLCDLRLGDGDGLDLLREVRMRWPLMPSVLMTGYPTVDTAIDSLRIGLVDYLPKPIYPSALEATIRKVESGTLPEQVAKRQLVEEPEHATTLGPVWGSSPAMTEIVELVEKVARTQATVLITGESGTGKELIAQTIWQLSDRSDKPFIKVNCGAVPENLLESEFFGHERGAFTGAISQRQGRFEVADKGTLLLDEIGEIPMALQVKLLRVLQEMEFQRVGGNETIPVDVRIVASTNRDLLAEVKEGRFREDLYYRLNVVPIHLPPLRQRGEDLDMLAVHFLESFSRRHGKPLRPLSDNARGQLHGHPWPGNVRELQNAIERSVILADNNCTEIEVIDFGRQPTSAPEIGRPLLASGETPPALAEMERRLIGAMLIHTRGNRTRAAEKLGISLRTLRNKLALYRKEGFNTDRPEGWS